MAKEKPEHSMSDRELTDHDLLIELNTKTDSLMKQFTSHLHHHFLYTMALFTALLSVVGGIVVYIATRG